MARGDRSLAGAIEAAWRAGQRFDAWSEEFSYDRWLVAAAEAGVDLAAYAQRDLSLDAPTPWSHISAGVSERYLKLEWERAKQAVTTPDCTFVHCTGCGACQALGADNDIKGVRHG